jgi:pimeloyl-ACP methyl ester carboxylesterase
MQGPLARQLARRGNRVITLDPLGHGDSNRPLESWHYSMTSFAHQTVALLDHLGLERAVIGGTSLGANITLEVASQAPERLQGMVVEMPVLDNAIPACGVVFTPLLMALKFGGPAMAALARVARAVPRRPLPALVAVGLDSISQDPAPRPRCWAASSTGASPLITTNAPALRRRRSSSATPATRCTRSQTPTCSPTSSPTGGWSMPARSSSCGCVSSVSPERLRASSTSAGRPGPPPATGSPRRRRPKTAAGC